MRAFVNVAIVAKEWPGAASPLMIPGKSQRNTAADELERNAGEN